MRPYVACLANLLLLVCGCTAPALRSQSPEDSDSQQPRTRLVGDVARPFGTNYVKVESVAVVTGLAGTGEDPPPSPQRSALLHELQTIGVHDPNQFLASTSRALVLVRGYLPPGVRKGDRIDLEVQTPNRSGTSSLRGGWLMETRMTELAVLGGQIHEGHPWAIGEGALLVDPSAEGDKDRGLLIRGRVLGGGVALKSRDMGLFVGPEDKSVRLAKAIEDAINRRFHSFDHGIKTGVATARTDERIDLKIHPRYKENIGRYVRVVRSIPIKESSSAQTTRIALLERQLLDPITAPAAAIRLEALGHEAKGALMKGVQSNDPEVRFYAAEALAYLDESEAAAPLARAAREEPAFRAYALAALSAVNDISAHDELINLLDLPSAETRYGAFRALWTMNPNDPLIRGENLGGQFSYHLLATTGPQMVHVTRSLRPEVVVFGHEQRLETPFVLEAGKAIMVKGAGNKVSVSKFVVGQQDQIRTVGVKLDEVIRAIVELGGTYPDVVQALQEAKSQHALDGRFEIDAVPDGERTYRNKDDQPEPDATASDRIEVATPRPEMFSLPKLKTGR